MTPLEIAGNVFVLLSVYLARRNSVHTWWAGMIGVTLYGFLFFDAKLYADVVLQVFFFGTCVVGWWQWQRGGTGGTELPVTTLTPAQRIWALATVAAGALTAGTLFSRFTDAALPFADSFILAGSVVAQLLMMRRKIDHWPLWITVDIVAVIVYAAKALYLTSAVYALLLALCIQGLITWRGLVEQEGLLS
ncbi:MAG: nicotinamide riboside transporter PnuC [Bacteroidota bacterium]